MDTDDNRMATTRSMVTGIILSTRFRTAMTDAGFTVAGEEHAICPVCIFIEGMMRAVVEDKTKQHRYPADIICPPGDVVGREVEPRDGQDDAC